MHFFGGAAAARGLEDALTTNELIMARRNASELIMDITAMSNEQYRTVPNSTEQYRTVPNSTEQYRTVPNSTGRTAAAATAAEEFSGRVQAPSPSHPGIKYPVRANPSLR